MKQKFLCILFIGTFLLLSGCANQETNIEAEDDYPEYMAYITDFDNDNIRLDPIEWVQVPSDRADELGISDEDAPNGFYIYNPDFSADQYTIAKSCKIIVLDWENSFQPVEISKKEFITVLQERGEHNTYIPYLFEITDGKITEIYEHYVP